MRPIESIEETKAKTLVTLSRCAGFSEPLLFAHDLLAFLFNCLIFLIYTLSADIRTKSDRLVSL